MSKRPPESMIKTKIARMRVNSKGREEWMFFNPTIGIYQSKKIKKKRMRQEITNSPIKILFFGRLSKTNLLKMSNVKTQSSNESKNVKCQVP